MARETYATLNLFDWTGGLRNRRKNPLWYPENAVFNGVNMDLSEGCLSTRPGTSVVSEGSLPPGEVVFLKQVRFPTNESSYLLAQVNEGPPEFTVSTGGCPARWNHSMVWDSDRSRLLVFGGESAVEPNSPNLNDLWQWTALGGWAQLQPAGTPPDPRFGHTAIYDAVNRRMVVFGGNSGTQDYDREVFLNDVWSYDCVADEWSLLSTTGAQPDPRVWPVAVYTGTAMVIWAGASRGGTEDFDKVGYVWSLDLSTLAWSHTAPEIFPPGLRVKCGAAYDSSNDKMIIFGGATVFYGDPIMWSDTWEWSFASSVWTQLADAPKDGISRGPNSSSAVIHGSKLMSMFGLLYPIPSFPGWLMFYDEASDSWTVPVVAGNLPSGRFGHAGAVSSDGTIYTFGGQTVNEGMEGGKLLDELLILGPSVWTRTSFESKSSLWACDTLLPTDNAVFTKIYDLGAGAGTVSAAVLNDRCVITEGKNQPPLVWGGAMADDASDWLYPMHALVTMDGNAFYDVSPQVLDRDVTNEAVIGGILPSGYIGVCCDSADVEAFYIEVKTPNDVNATSQHNLDIDVLFQDDTYVDRDNFKYSWFSLSIDRWESLTGAFGYLENPPFTLSGAAVDNSPTGAKLPVAGGNPISGVTCYGKVSNTQNYDGVYRQVTGSGSDSNFFGVSHAYVPETLSPPAEVRRIALSDWGRRGTYEPDIQPNLLVVTSSGTATVKGLVNEAPGLYDAANTRVELYSPLATSAVSGIYALETRNGRLTVHQNTSMSFSTSLDVSAKSGLPALYFTGCNGFSVRQVISGSEIAVSGNYVRISLKASNLADAFGSTLDNQGVCLSHVSIVERSGETVNGTTTPTEITFSGGRSGVTIARGEVAVSDPTPFVISSAKSYLLIMDVAKSPLVSAHTNTNVNMTGRILLEPAAIPVNYAQKGFLQAWAGYGGGYYIKRLKCGDVADAPESWDQQTPLDFTDCTSATAGYPTCAGLCKIEASGSLATPTGTFVGFTNDMSKAQVGFADGFNSVSVAETKQGASNIYYCVSLDEQQTYRVFKAGAWRLIIRNIGGVWQYNSSANSAPNWTPATKNTKYYALRQALSVTQNRMTGPELNSITSAQWLAPGGVVPGVTPSIHFGFGLTPDGANLPFINGFKVSLVNYGSTSVEGLTRAGWSGGAGWSDGTQINGASLAQTGIVKYDGSEPFRAQYGTLSQVPGFWFRFKTNGASPGTSITRIMYKAPCQPLQNIGDGQADSPIGFVFTQSSSGALNRLHGSGGRQYRFVPIRRKYSLDFDRARFPVYRRNPAFQRRRADALHTQHLPGCDFSGVLGRQDLDLDAG